MAKILYLEDEAWQVENTVITFLEREMNHSVQLVHSIDAAIERLQSEKYDVVFLDIMMNLREGIITYLNSGFVVAHRILDGEFRGSGNTSNMPIVIASGVPDTSVRLPDEGMATVSDCAHDLGIPSELFLRKPFLWEEVRDVIKVIESRISQKDETND